MPKRSEKSNATKGKEKFNSIKGRENSKEKSSTTKVNTERKFQKEPFRARGKINIEVIGSNLSYLLQTRDELFLKHRLTNILSFICKRKEKKKKKRTMSLS